MIVITRERLGFVLLALTGLLSLGGILAIGPVAQDMRYHLFADNREIWSIPNFWNVVTNAPFAIVGLLGLQKLRSPGRLGFVHENRMAYTLLFFGTFLVSIGSSYYHLEPDNQTLVWDRLPMTIAFMALFSIIVGESVSVRSGRSLLLPLILAGILSVMYWHFSEVRGQGDLRFYGLVQFYPMLAVPVMLLCFRPRCTHVKAYWWLLLIYIAAKVFELLDHELYDALGFISGHSLKHLTAALGIYVLLLFYQHRRCR